MEQNLEKSGQNLDPMFFWQFVKTYPDRLPCILIKGGISEGLRKFLSIDFPVNIIVEDGEYIPEVKGVLYRQRSRLSDKEWLRGLSNVDYLVCDKDDKDYWIQVALCGVKPMFSDEDWVGERIHVLPTYERIENWENARKMLDLIQK